MMTLWVEHVTDIRAITCVDDTENGITGDILIHLDHESLKDIGVESVGHRLTILREVYNIKIADNVAIEPEHYVPASMPYLGICRSMLTSCSRRIDIYYSSTFADRNGPGDDDFYTSYGGKRFVL